MKVQCSVCSFHKNNYDSEYFLRENVEKVAPFLDGINYHGLSFFYFLIYKLVNLIIKYVGGLTEHAHYSHMATWHYYDFNGFSITWMSRC
jgi:hypothetical protein